jgi:HlyD family secretion protein
LAGSGKYASNWQRQAYRKLQMITLKKSHFILIALIIAALIFLGLKLNQGKPVVAEEAKAESQSATKAALTVDLVRPTRNAIAHTVAANGSISPWQEAIIGSESNGLMLTGVLVNVGDSVKQGQLLAQFSASTIAADMAQAQANLSEAKANALEAADNAARARSIQDTGALSAQQIEQYIMQETTSKARVAAAEATLQSQQIRNKQTKVTAPDSGIISARAATVGAVVSPGQELFKLIRQGRLEWRAELTSSDIGQIKNGMIANLTLPDGNAITGKVRTTSPMVDMQTRNAIVFVDIAANQAKAGMFARGTFDIGTKDVLTLPAAAIVMKDGFAYVMQVAADGRIKQLKIQTGERAGANVEVIGLDNAINSDFVASGGAFLADGDLVTVAGKTATDVKPISKKE